MSNMRLITDSARCSGCRACLLACSLHQFKENNPKKAALAIIPHFPTPGVFEIRVCTQCGDCADVCPVDCITQNEQGAYQINMKECILCMACIHACPEEVIFSYTFDAEKVAKDVVLFQDGRYVPLSDLQPGEVLFQCDLCGDCVDFCGMGALAIGD